MSKVNDLLIAESEKYVSSLLAEKLPGHIIYHNFHHILLVKNYAEIIGEQSGLSSQEMNLLRLSALFHDTGYVNSYENHNEESVAIARAFLADHGVEQQTIDQISEIIRAVRQDQSPKDKIAEVLCDADMMYIASESCIEQFDLLFEESALVNHNPEKRNAYERTCIGFLSNHSYFTEYGKTVLQPLKEAAVKRLSDRMSRRKLLETKKTANGKKSMAYSRGVDTLFRLTARNQINLNSIADNKSNILISVNAIIISIIITMLAGNIGNMSHNILPILVFLIICLITIIIAILSTRPIILSKKFTEEDLRNKNVDLIFFGNFIKMDYDDYVKAVREMMKDDEHLYSTMIKNQYSLGKILSKKFRLVKIAYNVFMVGIILTVVLFLVNIIITRSAA